MTQRNETALGIGGYQPRSVSGSTAPVHSLAAGILLVAAVFVGSMLSLRAATAHGVHAFSEPDTGLVVALLACAVILMGGLSAAAVRFAGRRRPR